MNVEMIISTCSPAYDAHVDIYWLDAHDIENLDDFVSI